MRRAGQLEERRGGAFFWRWSAFQVGLQRSFGVGAFVWCFFGERRAESFSERRIGEAGVQGFWRRVKVLFREGGRLGKKQSRETFERAFFFRVKPERETRGMGGRLLER